MLENRITFECNRINDDIANQSRICVTVKLDGIVGHEFYVFSGSQIECDAFLAGATIKDINAAKIAMKENRLEERIHEDMREQSKWDKFR